MIKKVLFSALVLLFSGLIMLNAQSTGNGVVNLILNSYSAKIFTNVPVSDVQIEQILQCGIKAPSGRNLQPWKFTVVKDQTLTGEILQNITAGNILIVVSGQEKQDGTIDPFDCALATENMYVAAQSLGLGAHIYFGPVATINTTFKDRLGIPAGFRAVTVLRIGNTDKNVDAVSSASTRKKAEEVVVYR